MTFGELRRMIQCWRRRPLNHDGMGCGVGGLCPECYDDFRLRFAIKRRVMGR